MNQVIWVERYFSVWTFQMKNYWWQFFSSRMKQGSLDVHLGFQYMMKFFSTKPLFWSMEMCLTKDVLFTAWRSSVVILTSVVPVAVSFWRTLPHWDPHEEHNSDTPYKKLNCVFNWKFEGVGVCYFGTFMKRTTLTMFTKSITAFIIGNLKGLVWKYFLSELHPS